MFQPTIKPAEARHLVARGAQLVDVRSRVEYRHHALPGSVNIPLAVMRHAYRQLDRQTPVLLYCNSGQRSGQARQLLEACGFSQVYNIGTYLDLSG